MLSSDLKFIDLFKLVKINDSGDKGDGEEDKADDKDKDGEGRINQLSLDKKMNT